MQHEIITKFIALAAMVRAPRFATCFFLTCTLLFTLHLDATEPLPHDVGIVLKLKGKWGLDGNAVVAGQKLPAGGKIYHAELKPDEPPPTDYISVVFFDGAIESRSWDNVETWSKPIQLPSAPADAPSGWSRIVSAVIGIFPGHPEKYTQMSVRSPAIGLQDAVVDLKNGELDVRSAFKNVKEGKYRVMLHPIQQMDSVGGGASPAPVSFDWNPNRPSLLRIEGVQAGLYKLRLQNADTRDSVGNPDETWILVSNHAQYPSTAKAFENCISLTEQWAGKAPADAARSFCRAYLDSLAAKQNR